jgi:hypothetical protein
MVSTQQRFVDIGYASEEDRLLIEQVFGPAFFITDETGQGVTTLRNQRLLGYAKEIVTRAEGPLSAVHQSDLVRLGQLADALTPADSQLVRESELAGAWRFNEFDHAECAGSLE